MWRNLVNHPASDDHWPFNMGLGHAVMNPHAPHGYLSWFFIVCGRVRGNRGAPGEGAIA